MNEFSISFFIEFSGFVGKMFEITQVSEIQGPLLCAKKLIKLHGNQAELTWPEELFSRASTTLLLAPYTTSSIRIYRNTRCRIINLTGVK